MNYVDKDQMRSRLEELDIPQDKIDEFIAQYPENEEEWKQQEKELNDKGYYVDHILEEAIAEETDWKKKASLTARKISRDLE